MVQLFELRTLLADDIPDLASIFRRKNHARVACVAYACYALEKLFFRELGRQGKKGDTDSRGEVDLLRQPNPRIIFDDAERLMHSASEIQSLPVQQVRAEVVDSGYAVLDFLRKKSMDGPYLKNGTRTTPFIST